MYPSLVNGYAVLDGYGLAAATLLGVDFFDREPMAEVVAMPRTRRFFTTEVGYAKALMTLMPTTTGSRLAEAA